MTESELLLSYGFHGGSQGTVVAIGHRTVRCKMDRNGKVVRLEPSNLRIIEKGKLPGENGSIFPQAEGEAPRGFLIHTRNLL